MADILLVHDVGHGSWCWGRVWGHLTAPVEHPPRLYAGQRAGKVVSLDLSGLSTGDGGRAAGLSMDDLAAAVTDEVRSQGLRDVVMAGHGVSSPALLKAASMLDEPPRRVVLFAGIVPDEGKTVLDVLPRISKMGFKMLARLNGLARKELRLPKAVITNVYCNGMDPFDVIQIVGRFTPLSLRLLRTRVYLNDVARNFPITYVPLWRDRLVPPSIQRRIAEKLNGAEVARELDSCHEVMIEAPKDVAEVLLRYV